MDVSTEYIKMCEKATEIQKSHSEYKSGDWFSPTCNIGSTDQWSNSVWIPSDSAEIAKVRECYCTGDFRDLCAEGLADFQSHLREEDIALLIWLPRQDQLQEMVRKDLGLQSICWLAYEYSTGRCAGITISGTMEQLWLGIVMSENYNKVWNGEDWVICAT
jgi:hypothetical protein